MSELYSKIDTIPYFEDYPYPAKLEYIATSVINDFKPKIMSLDNASLCLCTKGAATYTLGNSRSEIVANDLYYVNPHYSTSFAAAKNQHCTLFFLGISNMQFASNNFPFGNHVHLTDNKLTNYIQNIYNEAKSPDASTPEILRSLFTVIILELQRIFNAEIQPYVHPTHSQIIADIAEYLDKNFLQHISTDDLCNIFCLSKSSLMHTFKKAYGTSPLEYVMQRRLKEALYWLEKSNMAVSAIAANAGFSSMPYFYKYFTKKMHVTPTEYRKSFKKN